MTGAELEEQYSDTRSTLIRLVHEQQLLVIKQKMIEEANKGVFDKFATLCKDLVKYSKYGVYRPRFGGIQNRDVEDADCELCITVFDWGVFIHISDKHNDFDNNEICIKISLECDALDFYITNYHYELSQCVRQKLVKKHVEHLQDADVFDSKMVAEQSESAEGACMPLMLFMINNAARIKEILIGLVAEHNTKVLAEFDDNYKKLMLSVVKQESI